MMEETQKKMSFIKRWLSHFIHKKKTDRDAPTQASVVLLSNHKTGLLLSASGHISYINGREAVFLSDFDPFSLRHGMEIYVDIDGTIFPTVSLGKRTVGFHSEFSFFPRRDMAEYRSLHIKDAKKYEIRLIISVLPDKEISEFSCAVTGDYRNFSVLIRLEPILAEKKYYVPRIYETDSLISRYLPKEEAFLLYRLPKNEGKEIRYFGMTASDGKMTVDCSQFPVYDIRCDTMDFGQRISFYCAQAWGEEEILYLLEKCRKKRNRKQRRRKMGMLLQLQYVSSGLSQPADAFEHFLLRKFLFDRPILETSDALSFLERYGIYGENPIVIVRMTDAQNEEERLSLLLRFFKYHCIRGLRYDLILLYRDSKACRMLTERIRKAGCAELISFDCGIYPLHENSLSDREHCILSRSAAAELSLSEDILN